MNTSNNMINVLIKDGTRIVNWDYYPDKTVPEILKENDFKPVMNTVRVCGEDAMMPIRDMRLSECPQVIAPDGKMMRVVITLESVRPKQKPKYNKIPDAKQMEGSKS